MALAPDTVAAAQGADREAPLVNRGFALAFWLVTSLFFMWAIANNFNDILIKQFQKALDLTRMQSGLVQTAFYFGYFTMALPAGWLMTRIGYKRGIILGLLLYAAGAAMFWPAAEVQRFSLFLFALYVIATGLAFLETAANPYIVAMGPAETAARRLNLAQSFNGLGGFVAPFLGGALILSGIEHSAAELAAHTPEALAQWRAAEARAVQLPYLGLAAVVLLLAAIIWRAPFPALAVEQAGGGAAPTARAGRRLPRAVVAQFFYVGAQVGVWSWFINFAQDLTGIGEKQAAWWLGISLMTFMAGRFAGTVLMRHVPPARLLLLWGLLAAALALLATLSGGWLAVAALGLTSLFMSIMFPTIFALGIAEQGGRTKLASAFLVMAIIGGALFPPAMGWLADRTGNIQWAMLLPGAAFLVVAAFAASVLREGGRP